MWVYTEFGEHVGNLHGVRRPAGQPAMCGHAPVTGTTAEAWHDKGYIELKEDPDGGEDQVQHMPVVQGLMPREA